MKKILKTTISGIMLAIVVAGCQKGDLVSNPNAINADATVPVSLILNHITANFIKVEEKPFDKDATYNKNGYKADQYLVSNYDKYWSTNDYGWSYSDHAYDMLKYTIQLENQ
uniref:hypothetical protein n=1 Tax=Pedobacter sp. UBA5917 TaxID=1947061 RepID=UPI0025ED7C3F